MALASLKLSVALACLLLLSAAAACHGLEVGCYKKTCPRVEAIVRDENVLAHKVLFTSDAAFLTTPATTEMVRDSANIPGQWEQKFNKAMVNMGAIEVKTCYQGEIRRKCRVVNH